MVVYVYISTGPNSTLPKLAFWYECKMYAGILDTDIYKQLVMFYITQSMIQMGL